MADPSGNTCAICMESLWSEDPIGANLPCGHVFHVHCGEGWRAAARGAAGCRCPLCNVPTTYFGRIFLDLAAADGGGGDDDDDDDSSLSDDDIAEEADGDGDDTATDNNEVVVAVVGDTGTTGGESGGDPPTAVDEPSDERNEIICIDDERSTTNQEAGRRKPESNAADAGKYKKRAKQLKRKLQTVQLRLSNTVEKLQELRDTSQESDDRIKELESDTTRLRELNHLQGMTLDGVRLDQIRLRNRCDDLARQLDAAERRAEDAEAALRTTRQEHARQLERASKNGIKEVDRIIADGKKLQEEKVRLEHELQAFKKRFQQLQEGLAVHSGTQMASAAKPVKPQNTKEMLKRLRQMEEMKRRAGEQKKKAQEAESVDSVKVVQGKISENAYRLARAAEKPTSNRPPGLSAIDLLNVHTGASGRPRDSETRTMDALKDPSLPVSKRVKQGLSSHPSYSYQGQQTLNFPRR